MRLTCPNCGAQYQIPDDVIPPEGRDVQCSNCGETWFQTHPDAEAEITVPAIGAEPDADASESQALDEEDWSQVRGEAGARELDPAIAAILQEEARREARLRAAEAGAPIENQPDLGLDSAGDVPRPPRRERLPEIEKTKGSAPKARPVGSPSGPSEITGVPAQQGSPFARGVAVAVLIAVALTLLYSKADSIADGLPWAKPVLDAYVGVVDAIRGQIGRWYLAIKPTLDSLIGNFR